VLSSTEQSVQVFAVIHFTTVGLSHLIQPESWVDFFVWLRARERGGVLVHGFLILFFGSIVVAFHNVWSGVAIVLTLVGYLYLAKALLCFVVPATQLRTLGRVSHERTQELRVVGIVYLALAGLVSYARWVG
jgi:hypothetical protein